MKRRITLLAICIGVAFLAVLAIQHSSQAQRPGGAGGGATRQPPGGQAMMMRSLPLESSWAYISFELGVADAELSKARKFYQEAWDGRKDLAKKMEESRGDRDVMRSARSDLDKLRADLDKKLKDVLTPEQLEKLTKWEEETRERARQGFGRQQRQQR